MATQTSRATAARAGHFCRIAHGSPRHAEARSERGGGSRGSWPRVTPEGRPRLAFLPLLSGLSEADSEPAWIRPPRGPAPGRRSAPHRRPARGWQRTNDQRLWERGSAPSRASAPARPRPASSGLLARGRRPSALAFDSGSGQGPAEELSVVVGRAGNYKFEDGCFTTTRAAAGGGHLPSRLLEPAASRCRPSRTRTCPGKGPGSIFREEFVKERRNATVSVDRLPF